MYFSLWYCSNVFLFFFFFNDTATTEIYTLSLHDALPISGHGTAPAPRHDLRHRAHGHARRLQYPPDRKSTRLNSSHLVISYAVFCLKKKNTEIRLNESSPEPMNSNTEEN